MSPPNLLECTASELATFLLENRFEKDAMATATYLLQATSSLPNAEALSAQLMGQDHDQDVVDKEAETATKAVPDLGDKLVDSPVEMSFTTPRGKHQVTFHQEGIVAVAKNQKQFVLTRKSAERLVCFPKPEDCKKPYKEDSGQDMILLTLVNEISVEGVKGNQVCFQLPKEKNDWLDLLCTSLNLDKVTQVALVQHPKRPEKDFSRYIFKSHSQGNTSTTTGGQPFVTCYKGVNDGVLYPLEEGLLFFKPPLFLPRSQLSSIACGRGGGGSSRYVDMVLQLADDDDTTMEFTNIARQELQGLNDYIHSTLIPAMKRDAAAGDDDNNDDKAMEEDDDSIVVVSVSSGGKKLNSRRKAAHEAFMTTKSQMQRGVSDDEDDDDDDEDYHATMKHTASDEEEEDYESEGDQDHEEEEDLSAAEDGEEENLGDEEAAPVDTETDATESEDDNDGPTKKKART